ncbi:MAG: sugar phosphate nucleotidyltransferase [Candidatus Eisenbacteria bacterium]
MTVFVLAGGLGTRIAGLYPDRPKLLVPVAGRPFVDHVLAGLAARGLTDVVLCAGHQAGPLLEHVDDGADFGVHARAVVEDAPRGTAGALAFARRQVGHGEETFLALNGDTWAEFDPDALLALHRGLSADATLACYQVDESEARGTVETSEDGRLLGFREKSARGPGWVSGGVYALEPRALASVPTGAGDMAPRSLEVDVFPALLAEGRALGAWRAPGRFWDMGTPAGRADAEAALARGGAAS